MRHNTKSVVVYELLANSNLKKAIPRLQRYYDAQEREENKKKNRIKCTSDDDESSSVMMSSGAHSSSTHRCHSSKADENGDNGEEQLARLSLEVSFNPNYCTLVRMLINVLL